MSEQVNKQSIIENNRSHDQDTGSSEVQIALLSARISHHRAQKHTEKIFALVVVCHDSLRRRKLLDYLKRTDLKRYQAIIEKLELRK